MEPLFCRLHVKDTEKGGPRAPPRNKMGIYEEFGTPSSRLARVSGVRTPLNSNDNGEMGHAHVGAKKRNIPPLYRPPASTTHTTPRLISSHPSVDNMSKNSLTTSLPSKFVRLEKHLSNEDSPFSTSQGESQNSGNNRLKRANVFNLDPKNHAKKKRSPTNGQSSSPECQGSSKRLASNSAARANVLSHESSKSTLLSSASENAATFSSHDSIQADETLKDSGTEHLKVKGDGITCSLRTDSCCESVRHKQKYTSGTRELECKTSVSISPYDVVLKLGEENFWKTRSMLIDQQRTLAFQVFELHRIVKVQRSFASSPHEFVQADTLNLRKGFREVPNIEELPPKSLSKDNDLKLCSSSLAPPTSIQPQTGTPLMSSLDKVLPIRFHPPSENQVLVPVISSEGLVYLPYPGTCPPNVGFTPHLYGRPMNVSTPGGSHFPITLSYLSPRGFTEDKSRNDTESSSMGRASQGTLTLFPMEPTTTQKFEFRVPTFDKGGGVGKETRAIKPVPIDGRRTAEFARRIFMSLQEERRQNVDVE